MTLFPSLSLLPLTSRLTLAPNCKPATTDPPVVSVMTWLDLLILLVLRPEKLGRVGHRNGGEVKNDWYRVVDNETVLTAVLRIEQGTDVQH